MKKYLMLLLCLFLVGCHHKQKEVTHEQENKIEDTEEKNQENNENENNEATNEVNEETIYIKTTLNNLDVQSIKDIITNPKTDRLYSMNVSNQHLLIQYSEDKTMYGMTKCIVSYDLETGDIEIFPMEDSVNVVYDAYYYQGRLLYVQTMEEECELVYNQNVIIERTTDSIRVQQIGNQFYVLRVNNNLATVYQFDGTLREIMKVDQPKEITRNNHIIAIADASSHIHYLYNNQIGEYQLLDTQNMILTSSCIYHRNGTYFDLETKTTKKYNFEYPGIDAQTIGNYILFNGNQIGYLDGSELSHNTLDTTFNYGSCYEIDDHHALLYTANKSSGVDALTIKILTYNKNK